jgi:hypothetical protein
VSGFEPEVVDEAVYEPVYEDFGGPEGVEDAELELVDGYGEDAELEPELSEMDAELAAYYEAAERLAEQSQSSALAWSDAYAARAGLHQAQQDAAMQVQAEAYEDGFRRAAELVAGEAGVTDPAAVQRVADEQMLVEREWWTRGLAEGASPFEMGEQMQGLEFQEWRAEVMSGLAAAEKYAAVTARTRMGRWRAARDADDRAAALLGEAPAPDVFASPRMREMAERMAARADRQTDIEMALAARQRYREAEFDMNRARVEAEHERRRFRSDRVVPGARRLS